MSARILRLTLTREWFDQIATGQKVEEYREDKPYWRKRFLKVPSGGMIVSIGRVLGAKQFDEIHFRNGYDSSRPFMRVEWKGLRYGETPFGTAFAIQLGKVLEIQNWTTQ